MDPVLHEQLIRVALVASAAFAESKSDFGRWNSARFVEPTPDPTDKAGSCFCRVSVDNTDGSERAMGCNGGAQRAPSYREGALFVRGYVPKEFGSAELDAKMRTLARYFHRLPIQSGTSMTVQFEDSGATVDVGERGAYYRVNLRLRFYVEDRAA